MGIGTGKHFGHVCRYNSASRLKLTSVEETLADGHLANESLPANSKAWTVLAGAGTKS